MTDLLLVILAGVLLVSGRMVFTRWQARRELKVAASLCAERLQKMHLLISGRAEIAGWKNKLSGEKVGFVGDLNRYSAAILRKGENRSREWSLYEQLRDEVPGLTNCERLLELRAALLASKRRPSP